MIRNQTVIPLIVALAVHTLPLLAADDPRLIPAPVSMTFGALVLFSRTVSIDGAVSDDDKFAARDLAETLTERGLRATVGGSAGYHISFVRLDSPAARRELAEHKIEFSELLDVVEIWVDSALRLNVRDLKLMQRLVSRQNGLGESQQVH